MCLVLGKFRNFIPRLATKDITVYKVMDTTDIDVAMVRSPYRRYDYELNKTYKTFVFPWLGAIGSEYNPTLKIVVERGFHSFPTLDGANELTRIIRADYREDYRNRHRVGQIAVVECIIPKGSLYFKGFWNNGYTLGKRIDNLVSTRLVIQKVVPEKTIEQIIEDVTNELIEMNKSPDCPAVSVFIE